METGIKLTLNDVNRAVLAGGNASAFAAIFHRALGDPPVEVVSRLDLPLALPQPSLLLDHNPGGPAAGSHNANKLALANIDLTLLPLAAYGKNVSRFLRRAIAEIKPDIIALDCCETELSAHILYAFSLFSALAISVRSEIQHKDTAETYLNKTFYPGNLHETAIIQSWLGKIPLLPVGQPPKPRRKEFYTEQGYYDPNYVDLTRWESSLQAAYRALDARLNDDISLQAEVQIAGEISLNLIKSMKNNLMTNGKTREDAADRACYIASRIMDLAESAEAYPLPAPGPFLGRGTSIRQGVKGHQARILAVIDLANYAEMEYIIGLLKQGITDEVYSPSVMAGPTGEGGGDLSRMSEIPYDLSRMSEANREAISDLSRHCKSTKQVIFTLPAFAGIQAERSLTHPKKDWDGGFPSSKVPLAGAGGDSCQEPVPTNRRGSPCGPPAGKPDAELPEFAPESTQSQDLFRAAFAQFIEAKNTEILTEPLSRSLVVEIVRRTRTHPDIVRGVSVRGTIAFEELVMSYAEMLGRLTRECLGKAALAALPPRLALKHKGGEVSHFVIARPSAPDGGDLSRMSEANREAILSLSQTVVSDISKEVLYDFSFSAGVSDTALSATLTRFSAADILANLSSLEQDRLESGKEKDPNQGKQPSIISETDKNNELRKYLEENKFLKKDEQGRYSLTKKALEFLMDELKRKLEAGDITPDQYAREKALLDEFARENARLDQYSRENSRLIDHLKKISHPTAELARTIMEMMDAQDKLWEKEVNFSTMHVYYHIKENSDGAILSAPKRDYNALKRLINDLERQNILMTTAQSSGFILTGLALNILLKYLLDYDSIAKTFQGVTGSGKSLTNERNQEIRRYSSGDAFRDISVRHTLKEIVRQKKGLSNIRNSDFRVFLKQPRKPQSDIIICLDTSGSMGFHQKLTYARLVAAGLVQAALGAGNRIGIVAFNDYGQVTVPLTDQDKDSLFNCIAAVTPRGNTNIGDGIKSSRELLFQTHNHNQKYIILVTDGQPTAISEKAFDHLREMKEKDLTEEAALLETRQASAKGARVSVIHIASKDEASGVFIKNIAQAGKGKIRRISRAEDFKSISR